MSQHQDHYRNSQDLRQISAYLDGELDDHEIRQIEERLSRDAAYRRMMQELQRTWDALDVLPVSRMNSSFTHSTMKLVVADARRLSRSRSLGLWKWPLRLLVFLMIPAVASIVTFLYARHLQVRPHQQLLQDLPIIKEFEVYHCDRQLTEEFLRRLSAKRFAFGNTLPTADDPHWLAYQQPVPDLASLAQSDNREKNRIRVNHTNFLNLDETEQQRLRSLREKVTSDLDADQLKRTLFHYFYWLRTLSESDRAKVLDTADPHQKIAQINSLVESQILTNFAAQLPKDDLNSVFLALLNLVSIREMAIKEVFLEYFGVEEDLEIEFRARNFNEVDRKLYTSGARLKQIYLRYPSAIEHLVTTDDIHRLVYSLLSDEAKFFFSLAVEVRNTDVWSEAHLLTNWMIVAYDNYFSPVPENLNQFYESLPTDVKDRLDNEHPDDRRKQLQSLWNASNR